MSDKIESIEERNEQAEEVIACRFIINLFPINIKL